jgi:hypothetical protein
MMKRTMLILAAGLWLVSPILHARQTPVVPAPDRRAGEGVGPFPTLTIRNVMVIDGTGGPPFGPANVVVENNRIARIESAGTPGVPSTGKAPAPGGERGPLIRRPRPPSGWSGARPTAWTA